MADAPASTRSRSGTAEAILLQVAAWLLPGAPPVEQPADHLEAERLVDQAKVRGLLGPLLVCADAGALTLPDGVRDRLVEAHRAALLWCLHVEQRLLDVADWFDAAGPVRYLVVKGPAVAHLDEPDASLRSFGDLDLLVHADDLDRALAVLVERGALRRLPQRRPGFDRRFLKSIGLTCSDGVELDVHRTFVDGPHGFRIPAAQLFEGTERFDVGGRRFDAPARPVRALHACYHAVVGSAEPPLRTVRDLATYLSDPDLGPEALVPLAEAWRGQAVLWRAVATTLATLEFDSPRWQEWIDGHRPDPRELRLLRLEPWARDWPTRWSIVREIPWGERPAYLRAIVAPSTAYLADRGDTPSRRLLAGLRDLRGTGARSDSSS